MTVSAVEMQIPNAEKVTLTEDTLTVDLSDGRTISAPLAWFPRLLHYIRSSACFKSAIRSSTSSRPSARRTRLSTMPMFFRYSSG